VARARKTLLWTSTTYFGEGLPWSFLHQMAMEFLTQIGASKTQISSTSLLHFSGMLKFLWSPIVDLFGSKRRWVWVMQIVLAAAMLAVAFVSQGQSLRLFWTVISVLAVLHATHDIACDGFYLQALGREDRALFSGTSKAAYRLAMWVGKSALVILAGLTSWFWGFAAAAALMLVVAGVNAAVMPHPPDHHPQDAGAGHGRRSKLKTFFAAYGSFLTQPRAVFVLSFMFAHRLGDIMMFAMSTPMLKDIGISTTQRGILASFQTVGFMVGTIGGGALIARIGLERCLVPMTFIQNLAIPLYILLPILKPGFAGVVPIIVVEQLASGIGTSANAVFFMQRCRAEFSAAHFAFATSLVSLASALSGFASGPINERLGHPLFFTVAFLASIPGLILVFFVPKTPIEESPTAAPASAAGS
jgi:MFS transporter, PAT family, beta-lactamase induction signal transducer AmpG